MGKKLIIRCSKCHKVKRFGQWIDMPGWLAKKVYDQEVEMLARHCERCA